MKACIIHSEKGIDKAKKELIEYPGIAGSELASAVSARKKYIFKENVFQHKQSQPNKSSAFKVIAYDFGVKSNILRILNSMGCDVHVVPARTTAKEILNLKPDGIFLSNGPGDPEPCEFAIESIKELFNCNIPMFGICLGHQLIALASGARTEKMKYGHHGANHPVIDVKTSKVVITSQNHGFVVNEDSLPSTFKVTHRSLFDNTIQGIMHKKYPIFSFQGHPEACPGPQDVNYLFKKFIDFMKKSKNAKKK
jgi:carbamoyl-phosphate synthase small subunit